MEVSIGRLDFQVGLERCDCWAAGLRGCHTPPASCQAGGAKSAQWVPMGDGCDLHQQRKWENRGVQTLLKEPVNPNTLFGFFKRGQLSYIIVNIVNY